MSKSQPNKLKSRITNGTEVTLNLSSDVIDNFDDETDFRHKLLLTDTQVPRFCKAFANDSSANIKFSKTQVFKMVLLGVFNPFPFMSFLFNSIATLTKKISKV